MSIKKLQINLADGSEIVVTPLLPDTWAFETALKNNPRWGKLSDNLFKSQQFKAFAAAKRQGLLPEYITDWESFGNNVHDVVEHETPDEDEELEVEGVGKDTLTDHFTTS